MIIHSGVFSIFQNIDFHGPRGDERAKLVLNDKKFWCHAVSQELFIV